MSRTAQDMQAHGVRRIKFALMAPIHMHVVESFAIPSHRPPPGQMLVNIDGYDYLVTVEFQDPR